MAVLLALIPALCWGSIGLISTIYRELERERFATADSDYLPYYRYFADTGQAIYEQHRLKCHSYNLLNRCWLFKMLVKALKSHLRLIVTASFTVSPTHTSNICPSTPTTSALTLMLPLSLDNSDLPKKLRVGEWKAAMFTMIVWTKIAGEINWKIVQLAYRWPNYLRWLGRWFSESAVKRSLHLWRSQSVSLGLRTGSEDSQLPRFYLPQ